MSPQIARPRGTRDFGPEEMVKRKQVERALRCAVERYGFREIATPTFEATELFTLKSGPAILGELYNFKDKGGRDIALRPELTAATIRFYLSELARSPKPLKLYYFGNCFRYERPQEGRYREFWQLGVETIGASMPDADAELIALSARAVADCGLSNFEVRIGHLGVVSSILTECGVANKAQTQVIHHIDKGELDQAFRLIPDSAGEKKDTLAGLLKLKGGLEIFGDAREIAAKLPTVSEQLGKFEKMAKALPHFGLSEFTLDLGLARGLDYYTGVIFEVNAPNLGAQKQVAGGGAYTLSEVFGGQPVQSSGWAIGFDRLILALEKMGMEFEAPGLDAYLVPLGTGMREKAIDILQKLRDAGITADIDFNGRGLGKAIGFADVQGAKFAVIVGEDEYSKGVVSVKRLADKAQEEVAVDGLVGYLSR